jgi:hypothetical protein
LYRRGGRDEGQHLLPFFVTKANPPFNINALKIFPVTKVAVLFIFTKQKAAETRNVISNNKLI